MIGTTEKTPSAAVAPAPGTLFAGDLRIERFLGAGGMGAVYLARDLTLEREVALKVLLPGIAADADEGSADAARRRERRFLREARIMAGLDHPSILPVHRVGEDPATGLLYLTMKPCLLSAEEVRRLCDGPFDCPYPQALPDWGAERRALSLADLLKGDKALPERAVAILARELVGAMAYAHRLRPPVIHRDVKPSNVLFDSAGRAHLTDFGIAKRLHGPDEADVLVTVTADGEAGRPFVGTVPFAAPEQSRKEDLTPAADYYSLGVVLYRALTGTMPSGLKPPSEFDPGHVSRRWDALLKGMLEPDPARRLADPDAVTAALDAILSRRPVFRRTTLLAVVGALALAAAALFARRSDGRAVRPDAPKETNAPAGINAPAETNGPAGTNTPFSPPPPGMVWHSLPGESPRLVPEEEALARSLVHFSNSDPDGAVWYEYGGRLRGTLRLEGRHLQWPDPLRLEGARTLEIVGPGRLDATFEGTPDALVVLRDCSVINVTEDPDPAHGPRFRLEAGSFLSFPNILSIFPNHYAEPYAEPDPNHPSATDRAVRFRSRETTLDGQMTFERGVLHDAVARAKEDVAVPIPGFGESIGWSGVTWTTGSVHPWRPDADRPDRISAQIPGGVGEAWLRMEFENSREFSFCYDKYFPGRNDHGGRGGELELFCDDQAYHGDGHDGVPKDGECPFNIAVSAPGRHVFEFRFRSNLCAPPGHAFGVRLRLFPAGKNSPFSIAGGSGL